MARFSLPVEMLRNPELVALHRLTIIDEIDRTLSLAEVMCLSFDDLLKNVENLPNIDNSAEVVFRACEYELSSNQAYALAESLRRLAEKIEGLPGQQKPKFDRYVKRILSRLPAETAWPVVAPWLEHKRKYRRETAFAVLRRTGIDSLAVTRLLKIFESTGDQKILELVARSPAATRSVEIKNILPLFEEDYWRMRLVEAVLLDDKARAIPLSADFPREFTHAVGRQKNRAMLPILKDLFEQNSNNLDFLSIYGWALGQLEALYEIRILRRHVEQMKHAD